MEFRVQEHRLSKLAARFNLMVALVVGLLVSNALLGSLALFATFHQKIEITPFNSSLSYTKSDASVDGHYLDLMGENFIYLRLNATPETVQTNHQRLLSYIDAQGYTDFLQQLKKEASIIQTKKVSSHFEITDVHSEPASLQTVITGTLKRNVGFRALEDRPMTYRLQYQYRLGRLTIKQFTQQSSEVSHAS